MGITECKTYYAMQEVETIILHSLTIQFIQMHKKLFKKTQTKTNTTPRGGGSLLAQNHFRMTFGGFDGI